MKKPHRMTNGNTEAQPQLFTYPQLHAWLQPLSAFVALVADMEKHNAVLQKQANALQQWLAKPTARKLAPANDWFAEVMLFDDDAWSGGNTPTGIYARRWYVSFTPSYIEIIAESEDDISTGTPSNEAYYYHAAFTRQQQGKDTYEAYFTEPISAFVQDVLRCNDYCTPKMQRFEADLDFE